MKKFLEAAMSLIVIAVAYLILRSVYMLEMLRLQEFLPAFVPVVLSVAIGIIFYFLFSKRIAKAILSRVATFEDSLATMSFRDLMAGEVGAVIGLVIANLIGLAVGKLGTVGIGIVVVLNVIFASLGFRVGQRKKDEVTLPVPPPALKGPEVSFGSRKGTPGRPKILDTSVIIDGRILDILHTGFMEGKIIIPEFVLDELRHIADSADAQKRKRGRRGLDILNDIQRQLTVPVEIMDFPVKEPMEVDSRLLKMAAKMDAYVVTNDYNLNKVAAFQGVRVLNINELANAVKSVVLPGEDMRVAIIKEGKEHGQGVAYLSDGTMIVVEGGSRCLGETRDVTVTSALQTAAGRMIFARLKDS